MRELKFRMWGLYSNGEYGMVNWEILNASNSIDFRIETEKGAMMQYTGLKDMSGKEIYEGDIVSWKHQGRCDEFSVCFGEYEIYINHGEDNFRRLDAYGFYLENKNYYDSTQSLNSPNDLEIVGNIYENPELLKRNQEKYGK